MMHSRESLEAEFQRVRTRPEPGSAPPALCQFSVDVIGDTTEYVERLRSVLSAAASLGATADFEADSLPVDDVPDWFIAGCSADDAQVPDLVTRGRAAYTERTGGRPWALQDWLFRFDPDEDSRGWEWWDATRTGPGRVSLWVDSWGESFFGCQDLLWAAYTAGATYVDGPTVRRPGAWEAEAAGEPDDA